jgi:hypothetical protein
LACLISTKAWEPDHPPEYVPEVARLAQELPESAREGFLGANVLRAFAIEQ